MLVRPLKKDSAILDVGCANGRELSAYWACGFRNLLGIDPYLSEDIHYGCGVRILKKELKEVDGKFDLIMFHHVLEHIPDQCGMLELAKEKLNGDGQIIVRIPLSDSETALAYREKWVQLDAPRHFFLHSRKSLSFLAEKTGLRVDKMVYDSEAFQFIGSELYRRGGISLNEFYADYAQNYSRFFNEGDENAYQLRANELNLAGQGDQAGFCLLVK
jgi:SAM-dependent methyltransferase